MTTNSRIVEVYEVGPRRVSVTGRRPMVYLPKEFSFLIGKKVLLTIKVLDNVS